MSPLELVLLTFAAYRMTRFLVFDQLMGFSLDSNSKLSRRLDVFCYRSDGADRSWLRGKLGDLLTCPYCLGFHVVWIGYCIMVAAWPWAIGLQGWLEIWAVAGAALLLHAWGPSLPRPITPGGDK